MASSLDRINGELAKLQQQRAEVAAKHAELVRQRESIELPVDIAKASSMLADLEMQVSAAERLLRQLDGKSEELRAAKQAEEQALAKAKARELDGELANVESDIFRQLDTLEQLLRTFESKTAQRAHVLGKVAYPIQKFGTLNGAIQSVRSNKALADTFSQK